MTALDPSAAAFAPPADDRARSALRFLLKAGRLLASSLEYGVTINEVAELVVPTFADAFAVDVIEDEEPAAIARAGQSSGSEIGFAMAVRDRELGTVRVARDEPFDAFEFEVFEALAQRIAVAVDAAQMYAQEHHVADSLQRALLPERLPQRDDLRFDAAYLPGAAEAIVGGDWYDAFPLPDGCIAVAIGDVAGHGLRAAVVMGEARQAFRAAAIEAKTPSQVLERANAILNLRERPIMTTAAFGIVDPGAGTFTYATAGHLPPILALADGGWRLLPSQGIPLGIASTLDSRDWTITIPAGAFVAFYTDGFVEYDRDIIEGERRLGMLLAELASSPCAHPARELVRLIFGDRENTDDSAVLTVARPDRHGTSFAFDFTGVPTFVPIARRALDRWITSLGFADDARFAILTAVGEAIANAVEHAFHGEPGMVKLRADAAGDEIRISVEDDGRWRPANSRPERGRGLPIMRALMDGVQIRTEPSRTCVNLSLRTASNRA